MVCSGGRRVIRILRREIAGALCQVVLSSHPAEKSVAKVD
jgi:hypothetical protein